MKKAMNNVKTKYGFGSDQDIESVLYGEDSKNNNALATTFATSIISADF